MSNSGRRKVKASNTSSSTIYPELEDLNYPANIGLTDKQKRTTLSLKFKLDIEIFNFI